MGGDREPGPSADRHRHADLARQVNPAPFLGLITAREAVAGLSADQLREQISALVQQLTALETELADLATTRVTLLRLGGHPDGQSAETAPGKSRLPADPRRVHRR